jgi:hypothetical protein
MCPRYVVGSSMLTQFGDMDDLEAEVASQNPIFIIDQPE